MILLTAKEAAQKWGVTPRRVQSLCNEGKIEGAQRFGRAWMIPDTAVFPGTLKNNKQDLVVFPRKCPCLDMTNIYNEVGKADECGKKIIENSEAYDLFSAQIKMKRGEINEVYDQARYFLKHQSGLYVMLGASMLLAQCAVWRGDFKLWNEVKRYLFSTAHETETRRAAISLTIAIIGSFIHENNEFPEWFKEGNFDILPAESHGCARVYYVKNLNIAAFHMASKQIEIEGMTGLAYMSILPQTVEPMITQAVAEKTVIPEIMLRIMCALLYHNTKQKEKAIKHLDRAVKMAMADKLYALLVEYMDFFDGLLEERIKLVDESALEEIMNLFRIYSAGKAKLKSAVKNRYITSTLTTREREIAKLVAFGYSVNEISEMLFISKSTVKQTITKIIDKTRVNNKNEFAYIL